MVYLLPSFQRVHATSFRDAALVSSLMETECGGAFAAGSCPFCVCLAARLGDSK